jgi:LysM repeat protein
MTLKRPNPRPRLAQHILPVLAVFTWLCVGAAHAADLGARRHALGQYDTVTATYVVAEGDDLAALSERFEVPLQELKTGNKLTSHEIAVGQKLVIPATPTGGNAATASIPPSITTPNRVETSIGTLAFKDGVPSVETAKQVFDTLDFTRALNAYNNSFRGASALALVKGFKSIGAESGDIIIFSKLMDSSSLFLTANADTIYYLGWIDLSKGPVVIEQPSRGLGTINDMWFQWVIDMGKPGPDRGLGGKYLIVGPGYDGPLPQGGYFVAHSRTNTVLYALRAFIENGNDPKPAVDNIKRNLKIYPYAPGSFGTPIAEALAGCRT